MQRRLQVMRQKETAEHKEAIARLEEALKKKDDELAALTPEQLLEIDMDLCDDEGGGSLGETGESPSDEGAVDNDNEQKNKAEDGQKKKDQVVKGPKKKNNNVVVRSIEKDTESHNEAEGGLFVDESEAEGSLIEEEGETDNDSDTDAAAFSDDEYGKALYTFPGTNRVSNVETVGWAGGRFTGFVNMYGKKSAARYRLERFAFPAKYEDDLPKEQKVSNPKNRYGDERSDNGKYRYTRRHIRGIFGVAWKGASQGISRGDLDRINPDLVNSWRDTPTYVLIAWDIDGRIQKHWETRHTLRARWGTKDADIAIYQAAVEAEDRYNEAKNGKRLAKSRSPSVGLAAAHVQKHREKSLGISRSSPSRTTPTTRSSKSAQRGGKDFDDLRQEFLTSYLELLGVDDFKDLPRTEKRDCIAAWNEEKAAYLEATAAAQGGY